MLVFVLLHVCISYTHKIYTLNLECFHTLRTLKMATKIWLIVMYSVKSTHKSCQTIIMDTEIILDTFVACQPLRVAARGRYYSGLTGHDRTPQCLT